LLSGEATNTNFIVFGLIRSEREPTPVGGKTVVPVHREPDGIEQLAQMFGSSSSNEMRRCTTDSNRYFISFHFLSNFFL
jgi:hypothetical protein